MFTVHLHRDAVFIARTAMKADPWESLYQGKSDGFGETEREGGGGSM